VTRAAGIATPAKARSARVRRVDLVALNERLVSLIVVMREGTIKQVLVNLDEAIDPERLGAIARHLDDLLVDRTAAGIGERLAALGEGDPDAAVIRQLGERVVRIMREYDAAAVEQLFSDGLLNVMQAPEFSEGDKLRRVFSALENRAYLTDLLGRVAGAGPGRVLVFIGHENPPAEMAEVSLVPYGRPGRAVGVVGVLGPTRMAYPHAMGTVRFVSGLMNELVDHLYA
jgi:heat-inducible transcriptional repressor